MSIKKRPSTNTPAPNLDAFINGAPDAATAPQAAPSTPPKERRKVGKQVSVSLALPEDLLNRIDAAAQALSISRAAFIKMAVTRVISAEKTTWR